MDVVKAVNQPIQWVDFSFFFYFFKFFLSQRRKNFLVVKMVWYNSTRCNDRRQFNTGRFKRIVLDKDKLKQLYHQGKLIKDLAFFFNCSIPTIKRHLKLIIPGSLRRYKFNYSESNPLNQKIIKLYTNHHYSTERIADMVDLADETVRRRLQRLDIELRGRDFKNLESFHPMQLNRRKGKEYPITDLNLFNQKFLEYYCLMRTQKKIAQLLQIDRGTVRRRIKYLRSQYNFKLRFCKRCEELFRFKVTEHQRNSNICSKCRLS